MKKLIIISLVSFGGLFAATCYSSRSLGSANQVIARSDENVKSGKADNNAAKEKETDSKNKIEYPQIFVGGVEVGKDKTLDSNWSWSPAEDDSEEETAEAFDDKTPVKTELDVDLMNCAGYLISAKIVKEGSYSWKVKFNSQAVSKEIIEKIKICDVSPDDKYTDSEVFAAAPKNPDRRTGKAVTVDTKKLFASLPKEVQKWANASKNSVEPKNNLTLGKDNWTDLDGDGVVDLVEISGGCGGGDYICSSIMYFVNGEWKKIGRISPA